MIRAAVMRRALLAAVPLMVCAPAPSNVTVPVPAANVPPLFVCVSL